jgi:hypothetical protein
LLAMESDNLKRTGQTLGGIPGTLSRNCPGFAAVLTSESLPASAAIVLWSRGRYHHRVDVTPETSARFYALHDIAGGWLQCQRPNER